MKFGRDVARGIAGLALGMTLISLTAPAYAQDHRDHKDRNNNRRDWDRGRDNSGRDRDWDRKHHWRSGDTVVDYPDYSAWHLNGGLYPVDVYNTDRASKVPWRQQRASFFAHASVNLGGHNYARVSINRNGRQYYSFRFGG